MEVSKRHRQITYQRNANKESIQKTISNWAEVQQMDQEVLSSNDEA